MTALDDAPLSGRHVALLCVLAIAVTLDLMKPITLSFVAPGMAREYGLKSAASPHGGLPVSLLPLAAIVGTVVGSLVRGALADRIGRRASVLLAAMLFVTTGICGAMPGFIWNLLMCFVMGAAVGGMIPVAFALIGETVPARHRGWLMVLIGGPAGPTAPAFPARTREPEGFAQLLLRPFTGITLAASVLALGAGLVTYGFQLWIPTNLQRLGLGAVNSDYMIRDAALISLPVTLAAALLYGFWSSRKTIAVLSAVTVGSLFWFAVGGNSLARNHLLFSARRPVGC